jgi:hypothetical protein
MSMNAIDVRPAKWLQNPTYPIRVLYDDGEYSAIWGQYEDSPALGTRWNVSDNSDMGYPNTSGNPTWYVEPDFFAIVILQRLQTLAIDTNDFKYYDNILFAINELAEKMRLKTVSNSN